MGLVEVGDDEAADGDFVDVAVFLVLAEAFLEFFEMLAAAFVLAELVHLLLDVVSGLIAAAEGKVLLVLKGLDLGFEDQEMVFEELELRRSESLASGVEEERFVGVEIVQGPVEFGVNVIEVGLKFVQGVLCLAKLDKAQGLEAGHGAEVNCHEGSPY